MTMGLIGFLFPSQPKETLLAISYRQQNMRSLHSEKFCLKHTGANLVNELFSFCLVITLVMARITWTWSTTWKNPSQVQVKSLVRKRST